MKIKIFSSFCSSEDAFEVFNRIFSDCSEIEYTIDDDYTHAIILNTAMPELKCPKENVIGLAYEPIFFLFLNDDFINYVVKNVGIYYIGERYNLPSEFVEKYSYMWHTPVPTTISPKTKLMSIIISKKDISPNHRYRRELTVELLRRNFPIDVWGNGCSLIKGSDRIKGEFNESEPYDGYLYTIAIENYIHPHYFSEKLTNALVHKTIPLYLGASSIDEYFPGYIIKLTGELNKDINIIYNVIINKPIININSEVVNKRLDFNRHILEYFGKMN